MLKTFLAMRAAVAALAVSVALAGCATTGLVTAYSEVTGASISSGRAITYNDGLRTIQDAATVYTNGCVAAGSTTGACAYADQVYADFLVLRADRKALLDYVKTHDGVPIGPGGVLALTETAVANIRTVLSNAGVTTPAITP